MKARKRCNIVLASISLMMLAITFIAAACGTRDSGPAPNNTASEPGAVQSVLAVADIRRTELTENAEYAAEMTAEPQLVQAGREATLIFTVKDKKGRLVNDLKVVHEKLMHLLVVSADLAQFDHLHPVQQPDGTFRVSYTFPNGGPFKLYTDFTPQNSPQVVDMFDLIVGGPSRNRTPLVADTSFTKEVEGLSFTLKADQPIRAKTGTMLNFYVSDKSGQPIIDLQPYLGAMAHFVVISEDTSKFLHVHAVESDSPEMKDSADRKGKMETHGGMDMGNMPMGEKGDKPTVQAHTEFPTSGLYKLWGQFQRAGKVYTVSFVLNVADTEIVTGPVTIPADAVRITVSSDGFQPSHIKITRGRPATLAFTRKDDNNCADEIVFEKLNIKKELPVGKTVLVELNPSDTDELAFACGMGMYEGKIIVR